MSVSSKVKVSRHSQLVQASWNYLRLLGYLVSPVKNIATPRKRKDGTVGWSRGKIQPGTADLLACSPQGRFVAVEIKVRDRNGKLDVLSPEQLRYKTETEQRGGLFLEVRETADTLIQAHKEGVI